ncbi:MAG: SDR family NAD(P)-dependent oxidoreductase [Cyclobacteriaceae bacterium]
MSGLLKDKSVVIIGGTSGIGLSAGMALTVAGADVVLVGSPEGPQLKSGKKRTVLFADARHEGVAEHAIERCVQDFGSFDGLYHVAGGSGRKYGDGPIHQLSKEGWDFTFELNLTSVMLSNRAAVNQFLKQKSGGVILNTGSVLADHPSPEHFSTHAYAASKAALSGLSKAMASAYASENIRVNVIAPGLTDTPMAARARKNKSIQNFIKQKQPLDGGRMARPSDLDGLAVFLFSDEARFITGQIIKIDGGWSVTDSF